MERQQSNLELCPKVTKLYISFDLAISLVLPIPKRDQRKRERPYLYKKHISFWSEQKTLKIKGNTKLCYINVMKQYCTVRILFITSIYVVLQGLQSTLVISFDAHNPYFTYKET